MQGVSLELTNVDDIFVALRNLTKHGRVLDLFRAWDEDDDGTIDRKEVRPHATCPCPQPQLPALSLYSNRKRPPS